MKKLTIFLFIFILLNYLTSNIFCDAFSYDFMENFSNAASLGKNNSVLCDTSNMSGQIKNPATTAFLLNNEVQINYSNNLGENYYWVGSSYQFSPLVIGLNYMTSQITGFEETTVSNKIPARTGETFSHAINILAGNVSYKLLNNLSAGINLKTSLEKIYKSSGVALALDVGLLYIHSSDFKISAALINAMSTNKTWDSGYTAEQIPAETLFGGEFLFLNQNLNISLYISQIANSSTNFGSGISYDLLKNKLILRGGFDKNRLTFGAGLSLETINIDYAYVKPSNDYLEDSHCFSLTFKLNPRKKI